MIADEGSQAETSYIDVILDAMSNAWNYSTVIINIAMSLYDISLKMLHSQSTNQPEIGVW